MQQKNFNQIFAEAEIAHNEAVKDGDISAFDKGLYVLRLANLADVDYYISVYEKLASGLSEGEKYKGVRENYKIFTDLLLDIAYLGFMKKKR